jgi:predicted metal-dependent hydrolase
MKVGRFDVDVVRKDIKNLHLGVYPPDGRIRIAVPLVIQDDAVRLAVIDKLGWIKRQQAKFKAQPRQSAREMVTGETHYFLGQRYRLRVHEATGRAHVALRCKATIDLCVEAEASVERRTYLLQEWYRVQLKSMLVPLLEKWQPLVGVKAKLWGVKRMKTKWGSCNSESRRVWFNLELAKHSARCLEYIVVHELVHLAERTHGDKFARQMDRLLPNWRLIKDELNAGQLGHAEWTGQRL